MKAANALLKDDLVSDLPTAKEMLEYLNGKLHFALLLDGESLQVCLS
jgi:hypothetical protein